jgi:hypothetical protein
LELSGSVSLSPLEGLKEIKFGSIDINIRKCSTRIEKTFVNELLVEKHPTNNKYPDFQIIVTQTGE